MLILVINRAFVLRAALNSFKNEKLLYFDTDLFEIQYKNNLQNNYKN